MNYNFVAYAQDFVSFLLQNLGNNAKKVKQVILFGSVAKGEANKKSDIDLFIDILDEKLEAEIIGIRDRFYESVKVKKYWSLFGINNEINCSIGKLEEWKELERSIIASGITLYGKYHGKIGEMQSYYLFVVTPPSSRNKSVSVWRGLYGYVQKTKKKTYLKEGLVKECGGRKLGKGVFIIPIENLQRMANYLRKNKIKHELVPFQTYR